MGDGCSKNSVIVFCYFFFFNDTATTEIYTLSLHDALPISDDSDPSPHPSKCFRTAILIGVDTLLLMISLGKQTYLFLWPLDKIEVVEHYKH